jgi:transposase-like protein
MSVLLYVHQLFNADQCHAYIHTLQWKDRPLQCPRCQSQDIDPWGQYHYRPGCKRYWCNGCKRTFNDLTNPVLHQSQRSLPHWILATFLLCLTCSSRRIAREVGVHIRTSYRWCWWLRNAALSYEMQRQVEGIVEADELYHTAVRRDKRNRAGRNRWAAARGGAARSVSPVGVITTKTGQPSSPGSVAREQSSSRRPAISPSPRCKRRLTSRCTRVVGSTRTWPAAIGR